MVRRTKPTNERDNADKPEVEHFGDERDSSDDSNGPHDEGRAGEDMEDEEFGDFAMPEVDSNGEKSQTGSASSGSPEEPRERILLKPLPVHPASSKSGTSAFGSLWPFCFGGKPR